MDTIRRLVGSSPTPEEYAGIEFWNLPERTGWLRKQGEYTSYWRRRWFVLKQGRLFWFLNSDVSRFCVPRGVIPVDTCITVKGAEDDINQPNAFQLSLSRQTSPMYLIADSEKEKEEWVNSIGRSIVQHSRSVTDSEIVDYDSRRIDVFLSIRIINIIIYYPFSKYLPNQANQ
ncbi:uncharacterized protein [Phyllobates terribilis]|uniref:uncharacterized protein n=1 Tax=Phyllobates terribilis TaxID=111132 RepID=UPI003CCB7286